MEDACAGQYINLTPGRTIDEDANQQMTAVRESLGSKANDESKHTFYLKWHHKGIQPSSVHSHADYIDNYQIVVSTHFMSMIEEQLSSSTPVKNCREEKRNLYRELLMHFHYCQRQIEGCKPRGFESIEEKLKLALIAGSKGEHQALIVHGPDGSGKTSLVSHLAQAAVNLLGKNTCLLIRYIGLTPCAMTLFDLLKSVCIQLHHVMKDEPHMNKYMDIRSLISHYEELLKSFSQQSQNAVIIIDGLDNLRPFYQDLNQTVGWIMTPLPSRVHLIVTISSGSKGQDAVFMKLKENLISKDTLFAVEPLEDSDIQHIVEDRLSLHRRTLSPAQSTAVCNTIRLQPVPLFISLLMEEAVHWDSRRNILFGSDLPDSLEDLINDRFKMLEATLGHTFISHSLRYLCSAHHGLSEMEMLDLLSCNNHIMLEILPQQQLQTGQIRFPVAIWLRLKKMLGESSIFCMFLQEMWTSLA